MPQGKPGKPAGMPKSGGRARGVPNKATAERARLITAAIPGISGEHAAVLEPLDLLDMVVVIARTRFQAGDHVAALAAASAALPYLRPKLSSSDVRITDNPPKTI